VHHKLPKPQFGYCRHEIYFFDKFLLSIHKCCAFKTHDTRVSNIIFIHINKMQDFTMGKQSFSSCLQVFHMCFKCTTYLFRSYILVEK
jgi:hypothetical protein